MQNIVYRYAFQYYKTGPLQYKFNKLMEKTITPILNHASQEFLMQKNRQVKMQKGKSEREMDNESTQISKSPQRQLLEEQEEQNKKKIQKKKRKKTRKLQEKQKHQENNTEKIIKQQIKIETSLPKQYEQVNKLLECLTLNEHRIQCRIEEKYIQKWKMLLQQNEMSKNIKI